MQSLQSLRSQIHWQDYLKKLKRNPSSQELRELIYLRGFQDYHFFVKTFLSHHCEYSFSQMHEDFIALEKRPDKRGRREVIAAPRGHGKTTFKVHFKVIHAIVYGYEPFIVILSHSAPEAEAKRRDILEELENNQKLIEVFGALAPIRGQSSGVARFGSNYFITQNGVKVMAKSRGAQVRGLKFGNHRPSLIILDDIESPDRVLNEEQRYKTRQWFEKDILKLGNVDGRSNIMVIGTCLHPEALLPELLTKPGWESKKYQAVLAFSKHEALWQKWRELYTDLSNPNREQEANEFYKTNEFEMLSGTEVLWKAESYLSLMKTIVNEGIASFQSEKQNDPYDPERQLFNMNQVKQVQVEWEGDTVKDIHWLDNSKRTVNQIVRLVAFHDPALESKAESDYSAIVVVGEDEHGFLYCLDAYVEKVSPSRQIEAALHLYEKWNFTTLYLETNNFQGILKEHYAGYQEQYPNLRILGVQQHHNKEKRIASLEPLITNGQLLFSTELSQRFISQMSLFPTSHDDGPDALHGAVEQLRKRQGRIQVMERSSSWS